MGRVAPLRNVSYVTPRKLARGLDPLLRHLGGDITVAYTSAPHARLDLPFAWAMISSGRHRTRIQCQLEISLS